MKHTIHQPDGIVTGKPDYGKCRNPLCGGKGNDGIGGRQSTRMSAQFTLFARKQKLY
jgi:hypothetical protein